MCIPAVALISPENLRVGFISDAFFCIGKNMGSLSVLLHAAAVRSSRSSGGKFSDAFRFSNSKGSSIISKIFVFSPVLAGDVSN
jgi:hypothetical protein